ncbi:hypothetical protein [Nostoc sp. DSM 114159]|jgi:hypothetical protein
MFLNICGAMPTVVHYAATTFSGASVTPLTVSIYFEIIYFLQRIYKKNAGVSQSLAEIFCCTQARKARVVFKFNPTCEQEDPRLLKEVGDLSL